MTSERPTPLDETARIIDKIKELAGPEHHKLIDDAVRGAHISAELAAEVTRLEKLHGDNSISTLALTDPSAALSVLVEEVGEVARALNDYSAEEALRAELVQVGACALAWILSIDQRRSP